MYDFDFDKGRKKKKEKEKEEKFSDSKPRHFPRKWPRQKVSKKSIILKWQLNEKYRSLS
jgi:hypothetical protein